MTKEALEKIKPRLKEAAKIINNAINEEIPIIIRHHADTDGICGSLILENAIAEKIKSRGARPDHYIYRKPSPSPYYHEGDILRDITLIERWILKKKGTKPLLVMIDNGSGTDDIYPLNLAKAYGLTIIIIDHHEPDQKITDIVDLHINPHIEGGDKNLTAGMLAYETAIYIHEKIKDNYLLPALSSIGDKSDTDLALVYRKESGKSDDELIALAQSIDYIAYHMKNDIATELLNNLLYKSDFRKIMTAQVAAHLKDSAEKALRFTKEVHKEDMLMQIIDMTKATTQREYPPPGKVTGLLHREKNADMTFGVLDDMIIVRMKEPRIPLRKVASFIAEKFPEATVDFGGHDVAGSIKFNAITKEQIIKALEQLE
jgi:archaea-specific RecJ-like exonuclease